jgi:hypothetical protein
MTQHEDLVHLRHMIDYALEAVAMVRGKGRDDLTRESIVVGVSGSRGRLR